jgi:hypothetical protein
MPSKRKAPRPFELHFGKGVIAEEATFSGEYHEPSIQLLEFTEGPTAGSSSVRFCYYSHAGRFQRSPLLLQDDQVEAMREALAATPKLRALLRRLVE